ERYLTINRINDANKSTIFLPFDKNKEMQGKQGKYILFSRVLILELEFIRIIVRLECPSFVVSGLKTEYPDNRFSGPWIRNSDFRNR
ncbi:hypothetical protein, partial [Escherichia coli]|uniref:hypothetical protein n=1 Tax=Escherichia coli TaxID=562 RepID=UPI001FF1C61D